LIGRRLAAAPRNLFAAIESPQQRAAGGQASHRKRGFPHGISNRSLLVVNQFLLGKRSFPSVRPFRECHLDYFRQVEGMPIGALRDLLAAAEAVGNNQSVGGSAANCG
jgi:hypothetical protein